MNMHDLVDTHCHIQSIGSSKGEATTLGLWAKAPDLTAQLVLSEAINKKVTRMICVGCDYDDSKLAVDFVQKNANCWASIGIHPHEAHHYASKLQHLDAFASLASYPKVIAIGECGLDYFYLHSTKREQINVLQYQIELALTHNLPIIFHVRDAFTDFWPIIDQYRGVKGVVHSFTDNLEHLNQALARGFYIGVNGIATFAKDSTQKEIYKQIPISQMVLETDAPFLTPTPYRGKINTPKQIATIADFIAHLRGEDSEYLAEQTTSNARRLFGF